MDMLASKIAVYWKTPTHTRFWAGDIIGAYFFENDVGEAITVNGKRYRAMITNLFWPESNDMDVDDMWFQEDGAMCHTVNATMDILHERSEGMIISRREGSSCVLGSRPGTCQPLRQCTPLWNLVQNAGRPMPQNIRNLLTAASCGYSGNDPLVCCLPSSSEATTSRAPQVNPPPRTGSEIFTPPDIQNHRNLRLLPTGCGVLDEDRIFGGTRTGLFEFPWMVLLSYDTGRGRKTSCGGTLISKRYVLTAAHCVTHLGTRMTLAGTVIGEHDLRSDPDCERVEGEQQCAPRSLMMAIEEAIPHPGYSPSNLHDDIAIVRLSQPVDLSQDNIKAICLPTSRELQSLDLSPLQVVVAGWGATEDGLQSSVLLKVEMPIVSNQRCQQVYNGSAQIDVRQVCAGGVPDKDSCGGDSGGPLMYPGQIPTIGAVRYVQHGVVSFGHRNCGVGGYPGVYTRVGYYMDWILNNMRS